MVCVVFLCWKWSKNAFNLRIQKLFSGYGVDTFRGKESIEEEEANMAATCEFLYMKKTWINAIKRNFMDIYNQYRGEYVPFS